MCDPFLQEEGAKVDRRWYTQTPKTCALVVHEKYPALHAHKGVENMYKQTEFRYTDDRETDCNFMSPLLEMRALYVHVSHPIKPGAIVLKPVFDGVYINRDNQYRGTVTVMIVSDRSEAWIIYTHMPTCPFAWLYRYWLSLGYSDVIIRIMEGLGYGAYNMANYGSNVDPKALEMEVEFNENQSEINLLEMEHEFGL